MKRNLQSGVPFVFVAPTKSKGTPDRRLNETWYQRLVGLKQTHY